MIKRAIRFLRGSVSVEVTSAYNERFLNMCWARGIELWGIRRMGEDKISAVMSARDYLRAQPLEKKCMCVIKVVKREGAAIVLRPLLGRYFLIGAAILCAAVCWLSTCFLWRISIYGCDAIPQRELMAQLNELGLETGRSISSIDVKQIKLDVMTQRDDIAYITINIKGTYARVDIKERDMDFVILPEGQPCDIISDRDGIIKSIQVLEGQAVAHEGDTVIAGDKLVSGTVTSSQGDVRQVRSKAYITLRTWRQAAVALSTEIYGLDETGRTRSYYSVEIGGKRIEGYVIEKTPFAWYYKTKEVIPAAAGDGFFLPVRIIKETYYECTPRRLELSEESCAEVLRQSCTRTLETRLDGGEIVSGDFDFTFGENYIRGVLKAECHEPAGQETAITQTGE